MKTRIVQRPEIKKEDWDAFVLSSSSGYAYHLYDLICMDRYKEDNDISFAIYDDDKSEIALIAMLHIEKTSSGYRLHSRYGVVIKDGLSPKEVTKLCNGYKEYIDDLFIKYKAISLQAGTAPLSECLQPEKRQLINPLMKYGYKPSSLEPSYTWICQLNGGEEELLMKCEQTTRQAIRKITKNDNYEIYEAKNCEEDYNTFVDLHIKTYRRTKAESDILHEDYLKNIFTNLIPQKICRCFFLKEKNTGTIISAVAMIVYKNSGYYWWGSSVDIKEVGVNKYLLWKSMMIIKRDFYAKNDDTISFWFEVGGAYPYGASGKKKGLNDFKKCFGCQLHPIYRGDYCIQQYLAI